MVVGSMCLCTCNNAQSIYCTERFYHNCMCCNAFKCHHTLSHYAVHNLYWTDYINISYWLAAIDHAIATYR